MIVSHGIPRLPERVCRALTRAVRVPRFGSRAATRKVYGLPQVGAVMHDTARDDGFLTVRRGNERLGGRATRAAKSPSLTL